MAALVVGLATLPFPRALLGAVLAALMTAATIEDWRNFRVPNPLNFSLAALGIAAFLLGIDPLGEDVTRSFLDVITDAALTGGSLLLVREVYLRLRGIEGLGLGDVKLGGAAGVWLGWQQFALVVFLGTLAALLFVLAKSRQQGHWPASARVPYASFLAPATWVGWYLVQWSNVPLF
ncbi:prepilin peptidase [Rhizobium grahamii]|uniref:Peptidase A24A, prepilin type IV n=2 Tax=Rhizobium grahamii TaxID=1120045 RepID=S3I715_9HYPH|nr:peptidase A24A, prepilin type IV [Rhizobium grahamii CCGE 502]RDJ07041.1 prepilin peptidase [Rhizobium grahamii]